MNLVSRASNRVLAMADGALITIGDAVGSAEPSAEVLRAYSRRLNETMASSLLELRNIETYYGPIMAIRGVSMTVREGQIVSLLGANGAGKTTVLKTISGSHGTAEGRCRTPRRGHPGAGSGLGGAARHWPCARGPRSVSVPHRRGKSAHGRLFARKDGEIDADIEQVYGYFPGAQRVW